MIMGKKVHKISKWSLAYHSKFTPWKIRFTTYLGISEAMAEQWG